MPENRSLYTFVKTSLAFSAELCQKMMAKKQAKPIIHIAIFILTIFHVASQVDVLDTIVENASCSVFFHLPFCLSVDFIPKQLSILIFSHL